MSPVTPPSVSKRPRQQKWSAGYYISNLGKETFTRTFVFRQIHSAAEGENSLNKFMQRISNFSEIYFITIIDVVVFIVLAYVLFYIRHCRLTITINLYCFQEILYAFSTICLMRDVEYLPLFLTYFLLFQMAPSMAVFSLLSATLVVSLVHGK